MEESYVSQTLQYRIPRAAMGNGQRKRGWINSVLGDKGQVLDGSLLLGEMRLCKITIIQSKHKRYGSKQEGEYIWLDRGVLHAEMTFELNLGNR